MKDAKNNEMISNDTHEECPYNIYKIVYKNNDFDYVMAFNNGNAAYQQFKKLVTFVGAKPNNHMFEEYKKGIENIIKVK